MTDVIWVVSSCVLIAAVIAVRAIFGKKMSAGLRYALWGLVLIRLLVPGTVFSSPVSVKTAVQGSETVQNIEAIKDVSAIARTDSGVVIGQLRRPSGAQPEQGAKEQDNEVTSVPADKGSAETAVVLSEATPERFSRMQKTLAARDILNIIWYTGMALAAAYFIAANLRFYLKLRARRQRLDIDAGCPVYSVEGLNSSCLFLNSIYISKENAEDKTKLNYVIEHEKAHRRHGDSAFALLRSAALVLHWYNPLVWAAAFLSRRDGELFADAGAIKALGDACRADYGRTLLELSTGQSVYTPIACAATMMTSNGRELKCRIRSIVSRGKMGVCAAVLALALAITAVGCTFAGSRKEDSSSVCLDAAWEEAEKIADVHGLTMDREIHTVEEDGDIAAVSFFMPDREAPDTEILLTLNGSDGNGWVITDRRLKLKLTDRPDEEKFADDYDDLEWGEIALTEAQLAEAGVEESSDGAARYAGRAAAAKLSSECPEDNLFKCSDAMLTALGHISSEPDLYTVTIAVKPVNDRYFYNAYSDCIAGLHSDSNIPEFMRCFSIRLYALVEESAEGYTVRLTPDWAPDWSGDAEGWHIDIDGDGRQDVLKLDVDTLRETGSAAPYLELADGTRLELPAVSTSHAGMATYGITELDGHEMLLYYTASWYSGSCSDAYMLLTVRESELRTERSGSVEFAVSSKRILEPADIDEVLSFVDEINDIWEHSRLLFSTDTDIALEQLYSRETGFRVEVGGGSIFIAPQDESYYCIEQLTRMDAEFDWRGLSLGARERLERANLIMAANRERFEHPEYGADAIWPIDIDHDGEDDILRLDLAALASSGIAKAYIELSDGTKLALPFEISTSHAGMGTYASVTVDGLDYLMYCRSDWYGGMCSDRYSLMYVKDGGFVTESENHIEYEISNTRPLPQLDKRAILDFVDEINAIWDYGSLLFSTDTDIAIWQVYNAKTGEYVNARRVPFVSSLQAALYGDALFAPGDPSARYFCREELQRFAREFNTDTADVFTPEMWIDTANLCMAQNSALYAAMEYLGIEQYEDATFESVELGQDGLWHITIRVADCPMDGGTADMIVELVDGRVVSAKKA